MLMVAPVKKPKEIPAVTHVDGTGRLQTVSKESNELYYSLINEFYNITGVPVIINTSMNVMGEPIVNTPEQAYSNDSKNRYGLYSNGKLSGEKIKCQFKLVIRNNFCLD